VSTIIIITKPPGQEIQAVVAVDSDTGNPVKVGEALAEALEWFEEQ
jgi:hypothetical protein